MAEKLTKESFLKQLNDIVDGAKGFFKLNASDDGSGDGGDGGDGSGDGQDPEATKLATKDGQILLVTGELAEGSEVELETAEGDMPAPSGMYELEDGRVLNITDGKVSSIDDSALGGDGGDGGDPGDFSAQFKVEFSAYEKAWEDRMEKALADQRKELTEHLTNEFNEKLSGIGEAVNGMTELMVKFADTPFTGEEKKDKGGFTGSNKPSSAIGMLGKKKGE